MDDRFSMKGRAALVTGASRSIGRAIALGFAEHGADVAINYAGNDAGANEVAELARNLGVRAITAKADLGEPGAPKRMFKTVEAALGRVDVLVVNASIQYVTPFESITDEQFHRQIDVNLKSTFDLLQLALPTMKERRWGRVLNIGSSHQAQPMSRLAVYAATKAAQHNLMTCLAKDYAPFGVTLNTFAPGMVDTDRHAARRDADPKAWAEFLTTLNWMKRAATSDEMVGAALLLCSDAGAFITGANLFATGGSHLP